MTLNRVGICMAPNSLSTKASELGDGHDKLLQVWKHEVECSTQLIKGLEQLEQKMATLQYLPDMPSIDDIQTHIFKIKDPSESVGEMEIEEGICQMETISSVDAMSLNLSWLYRHDTVVESLCNWMEEDGMSNDLRTQCLEALVDYKTEDTPLSALEACRMAVKNLQGNMPFGYQIIGDNLDLHVHAKHMTTANTNRSLHNFNMLAIQDDVSGNHLPDIHQRPLSDVPISEFLPSNEDTINLKQDFIPLWSRVIVKHLKEFYFFRNAVIYHIPHQYSEKMKECSKEVRTQT